MGALTAIATAGTVEIVEIQAPKAINLLTVLTTRPPFGASASRSSKRFVSRNGAR